MASTWDGEGLDLTCNDFVTREVGEDCFQYAFKLAHGTADGVLPCMLEDYNEWARRFTIQNNLERDQIPESRGRWDRGAPAVHTEERMQAWKGKSTVQAAPSATPPVVIAQAAISTENNTHVATNNTDYRPRHYNNFPKRDYATYLGKSTEEASRMAVVDNIALSQFSIGFLVERGIRATNNDQKKRGRGGRGGKKWGKNWQNKGWEAQAPPVSWPVKDPEPETPAKRRCVGNEDSEAEEQQLREAVRKSRQDANGDVDMVEITEVDEHGNDLPVTTQGPVNQNPLPPVVLRNPKKTAVIHTNAIAGPSHQNAVAGPSNSKAIAAAGGFDMGAMSSALITTDQPPVATLANSSEDDEDEDDAEEH
ncbi:hypothetical protein HMN09_00116200 [Mycena chlorophos]|uniref:Uncharacterized protein n=1 Tax=Mycena chlorophos TaxID=658473 RepID=A0A8H6TQL1_MYCCL|nr:hypothetical protein HMN09_00116200 [Mycena chlorophos]